MIVSVELPSSLFSPEVIIKKAQTLQIDKSISMPYCYLNCKLRIFANRVWAFSLKGHVSRRNARLALLVLLIVV